MASISKRFDMPFENFILIQPCWFVHCDFTPRENLFNWFYWGKSTFLLLTFNEIMGFQWELMLAFNYDVLIKAGCNAIQWTLTNKRAKNSSQTNESKKNRWLRNSGTR